MEILIADDHEQFRRSLRSLIESQPDWHVCAEAANGVEAVERASALKPDVILLDVSMPTMNGLDAARLIHSQTPETEILIVSQNDPSVMEKAALRAGAKGFIPKSKLPQELVKAVDALRGNGAARRHEEQKANPPAGSASAHDFMGGNGEMAERMRNLDWSQTPLGPMEKWPQSLKTSISICLASRFPIVMYWGPEYVVLYNDAYSTILGSKHPWALGQRCCDCWTEIWDTIGPMLDGVVQSAQATWSDDLLLMLHRHGYPEECYFSFSFSPIRIETGAVGGVFTAVIETTEKVIGERRLRTLRDLAARAVDADREQDGLRIAAETLGENLHDIPLSLLCEVGRGKPIRILGAAGVDRAHALCAALQRDDSQLSQHLRRVAESGETLELKDFRACAAELPHGAWQISPQSALLLPIGDVGEEHGAGVLVAAINPHKALNDTYRTFLQLVAHQISTSIADARSHQEERQRAEALAKLDQAKTAFFSNISHEFRTPLTLMLGPLDDLLARNREAATSEQEQLALIHRNSLRLLKLVNTLLEFSRIEAGRVEAAYEATDLSALTADLASVFRSATERAGVRLTVSCPPLPEPVYVDRDMWEKIVLNLLSNALKFTLQGEIAVELRSSAGHAELFVRDTGCGIPAEELPHIFERFHRVHSANARTNEGSGIGLAFVQELVKLHGGSIKADSVLGSGTTFTVAIPFGKAHLPADHIQAAHTQVSTALGADAYVEEAIRWMPGERAAAGTITLQEVAAVARRSTGAGQGPAQRILVADDNADIRDYLRRLLREHHEVMVVGDGQSALQVAREWHPDLILADVMMPQLDGFGLLRAVRGDQLLKSIPVILLSARAGEESRVEGLQAGADDYLVKPFSARELLARVASQLSMAHLRRETEEMERQLRAEADLERNRIRELFMQAPAAIAMLSGPEHRFTFVNREYLKVTGRARVEDFLGKPIREALPEIEGQEYVSLLDEVYRTGVPYVGTEAKAQLDRLASGQPQEAYFNFAYQPLRSIDGKVEGVLVHAVDVTQQVLTRKEIEHREQQFRTLAESIPQLVWMAEPDGNIFWYNQRWYEYTGTTPDQMQGWGWQAIHDPEVLPKVLERWKHSLATGDPFEMVFPLRGADGLFRDFLTRVLPIRNDQGVIVRWFGTNTDVSAQRKAEEALRESERYFREMMDALPAAIYTTDAGGRLTHFNAAALQFSGQILQLGSDEWCFAWKLFRADGSTLDVKQSPMMTALREGRIPESREFIAERADGKRIWFTPYSRLLRDSKGRTIGAIHMLLDITERKAAERTTSLLAAIVGSSDDAIVSKNLDGIITSWNRSAERLFGYSSQEAIGRHITLIIPRDRWKEEEMILTKLKAGEPIDHFETVRLRKDGTPVELSLTISPVRDASGRVIGASKVARDITERKRADRALRESEERFRKLSETLETEVQLRTRELEERTADVLRQSEQLRELSRHLLQAQDEERRHIARELHDSAGQTLTVLGINLAHLAEEAKRSMPQLAKNAEASEQLVQQLHQEIRTTSYLLHPPLLDETGLSAALSWYVEGLESRSGLAIDLSIAEDFQRLPHDLELVVFRFVQECLTNVHRHSGSKNASIRVTREAESVRIEVQDQGKGIPGERLAEIQNRGSGVGIRGMRERIQHFHGTMQIQSDSSGTKVSAVIPVRSEAPPRESSGVERLPAAV
ncbi:MAG TPA: PAS domain S-box protein [Terriglobales bacterium]|nr:PAS domain S-box protein [Terriglobales bacterium]